MNNKSRPHGRVQATAKAVLSKTGALGGGRITLPPSGGATKGVIEALETHDGSQADPYLPSADVILSIPVSLRPFQVIPGDTNTFGGRLGRHGTSHGT